VSFNWEAALFVIGGAVLLIGAAALLVIWPAFFVAKWFGDVAAMAWVVLATLLLMFILAGFAL